jgi:hypothetical protein
MTAHEFIKSYKWLPVNQECKREGKYVRPSNSTLRRWLERKSVLINGTAYMPNDEIDPSEPIVEVQFFPKGRTVTMTYSTTNIITDKLPSTCKHLS